MKINRQANNKIKLSSNSELKRFYLNSKIKLKSLLADVFTKIKKGGGSKVLHQGDEFQHEYMETRDFPNCISTSEDVIGTKLKKVSYYPEDIAKMEKMSKAEVKQYKKFLKQNGKYYYDGTYTIPKPLNSISAKDEKFGIGGGGYLRYFQEDIEKMKTMSEDEIIEFKRKLREEKKYYLE